MIRRRVAGLPRTLSAAVEMTVHFVAPIGAGAGMAADVAADVAMLAHHRTQRRREYAAVGDVRLVVESLAISPPSGNRMADYSSAPATNLYIVWPECEAVVEALDLPTESTIVVHLDEDDVPGRRQSWLPERWSPEQTSTAAAVDGLPRSARASAVVARHLPFAQVLWRRTLSMHAPRRRSSALDAEFRAAYADEPPAVL